MLRGRCLDASRILFVDNGIVKICRFNHVFERGLDRRGRQHLGGILIGSNERLFRRRIAEVVPDERQLKTENTRYS